MPVTGGGSVLLAGERLDADAIVLDRLAHMLGDADLGIPGIRRKLTVASAWPGSTLSLSPALKMVKAVVVRTVASVGPLLANSRSSSGLNSQRLDSATRLTPFISGAKVANISATVPQICSGSLLSSSRASAAAIMPIAVSRGGIEEWPGVASACSTSVV